MTQDIKIGDLVEDCSLMPGIVMKIKGDGIEVRRLDFNNEDYGIGWTGFSQCSLSHCGIIKITSEEAKMRLYLGKEKLSSLWNEAQTFENEDYYTSYESLIKSEYYRLKEDNKRLLESLKLVTYEYGQALKLLAEASGMSYSENNVTISAKEAIKLSTQ